MTLEEIDTLGVMKVPRISETKDPRVTRANLLLKGDFFLICRMNQDV